MGEGNFVLRNTVFGIQMIYGNEYAMVYGVSSGHPYINERRFNPVIGKYQNVKRILFGDALDAVMRFAEMCGYI